MSDGVTAASVDRLFAAIEAGDLEAVRGIVDGRPELAAARTAAGLSAILAARYRWRTDIVEVLLAADPPLDVFEAAAVGLVDRLAELVGEDAAAATAVSFDGFTPLHLAAFFGHATAIRLLLAAGADPAAVSRNAMVVMPLHSAAAGRQASAARALIDGGAPIDARTHGGYTPLLEAVANGDAATARILLDAGADPSIANDDGRDAMALARDGGRADIAQLLRDTR